jgi:CrcB protein
MSGLLAAIAVGSGAFAGAVVRWLLGLALNPVLPNLPLGTLAANLIGGLLVGAAMALFTHYPMLSPELRLFAVTGFLGGLTTFSTFSGETVALLLREQLLSAFVLVGAHLLGSLALTLVGFVLVQWLLSRTV